VFFGPDSCNFGYNSPFSTNIPKPGESDNRIDMFQLKSLLGSNLWSDHTPGSTDIYELPKFKQLGALSKIKFQARSVEGYYM
jgi:hypothetical protein